MSGLPVLLLVVLRDRNGRNLGVHGESRAIYDQACCASASPGVDQTPASVEHATILELDQTKSEPSGARLLLSQVCSETKHMPSQLANKKPIAPPRTSPRS